jgi:peptidoglycan/xylan/chitin deacetylase (PgdA/CDA1 family)
MTRLTILMYHRVGEVPRVTRHPKNFVTPARLAEHVESLLAWGYAPVSFADWMAYRAGARSIPPRPFIVTFDDGYADFDEAWPALRRLNVAPTVFLVASKIGGTDDWEREPGRARLLGAARIRALAVDGVTFGGHGFAHVPLADVSLDQARLEIEMCRATLTALLSTTPDVFAYPYSNQNAAVRRLTRDAGFRCAVRGGGRLNRKRVDPFGLTRILAHDGMAARDLRRLLMRLRWFMP